MTQGDFPDDPQPSRDVVDTECIRAGRPRRAPGAPSEAQWQRFLDHLERLEAPWSLAVPFRPTIREVVDGYQEVIQRLKRS